MVENIEKLFSQLQVQERTNDPTNSSLLTSNVFAVFSDTDASTVLLKTPGQNSFLFIQIPTLLIKSDDLPSTSRQAVLPTKKITVSLDCGLESVKTQT